MTRKRNSKGQFIKETNGENYKMELTIPNIKYLIKYTILLCILLPWIYLFLVKFKIIEKCTSILERLFTIKRETNDKEDI